MNFEEKVANRIKKLQELPESRKKLILWSIVGLVGLIMFIFWVRGSIDAFNEIVNSFR